MIRENFYIDQRIEKKKREKVERVNFWVVNLGKPYFYFPLSIFNDSRRFFQTSTVQKRKKGEDQKVEKLRIDS